MATDFTTPIPDKKCQDCGQQLLYRSISHGHADICCACYDKIINRPVDELKEINNRAIFQDYNRR